MTPEYNQTMNIIAWYEGNAVAVSNFAAETLGIKRGHRIQSESELYQIIACNAADIEAAYAIHKAKG